MKRVLVGWLAAVLTLSSPAAEAAVSDLWEQPVESLTDWHMAGSNTLRYNNYHTDGYDPSSIYPYEANQIYDEMRLSLDRNFSPYEYLSFSGSALVNDSRYRSDEQGFVFEDIRSTWQKGDAAVPFRLYSGDYTANLSYRTIQQNVKGAQLELQPEIQLGSVEQKHSIIGFSGMQQQDYRNIDLNRNVFSGVSWLVDLAKYGTWAAHYVHNYRQNDRTRGFFGNRAQGTMGATFEKVFQFFGQRIGAEAEIDHFHGDYDSYGNANGFQNDKSDAAYYTRLSGENGTLFDYGFRYEQYGNHFRPAGGIITPDRRTFAWKLGGKIYEDLRLEGRAEWYTDRWQSDDPMETQVSGGTLSGPLTNPWLDDLGLYLDVFRESIDGTDRTIDNQTWSYIGQLTSNFYEEWNGRLGFNIRNANDEAFDYATWHREYTIDAGHPVSLAGANGDARLGLVYRLNSGINSGENVGPSASLTLAKAPHSLYVNTQFLWDNDRSLFDQDLENSSFAGGYVYNSGPHRISLDCEINDRNPFEYLKDTDDYRFGFTYTFSFDKPVGRDPRDFSWKQGYQAPASVLEEVTAQPLSRESTFLRGLIPGMELGQAKAFLKQQGIERALAQGDLLLYEVRVFHDADTRQRLAIQHQDGRVTRAIYLIDLDPAQDPVRSSQIYERLLGRMLKQFGNPALDIHEGAFDRNYTGAVNAGQLVRATDWNLPQGTLRMGIPARFNQAARIEIHFSPNMPEARDTRWGLEQV